MRGDLPVSPVRPTGSAACGLGSPPPRLAAPLPGLPGPRQESLVRKVWGVGLAEPALAAGWGVLVLAGHSPPKGTRVPGRRAAIRQARVPEELIWGTIQTFGQSPAPSVL